MAKQSFDLQSPLAGASKELAYQFEAPFTSPELENVWPRDVFARRRRCGSRPGLKKAFAQQLSGTSVDLIAEVREATDTFGRTAIEDFGGIMTTPPWSTQSWLGGQFPVVENGQASLNNGLATVSYDDVGAIYQAITPAVDEAKEYTFTVNLEFNVSSGTITYRHYLAMDNTSPNGTSSVVQIAAQGFNSNGNFYGVLSLTRFVGSSTVSSDFATTSYPFFFNAGQTAELKIRVVADNTAKKIVATLKNNQGIFPSTLTIDKTMTDALAGYRWGFQLTRSVSGNGGGNVKVNDITWQYTGTSAGPSGVRNRIIAVGGTHLKEEDNAGTLVDTTETTSPTAGRLLQAVDLRGKLYIVNYAADTGNATTEPSFLVYNPANDSLKSMRDLNADLGGAYTAVLPDGLSSTAIKCELITTYRDALLFAGKRGDGNEWYLTKRGTAPETIATATAPEGSATAFVVDTSVTSFVVGSTSEAGRIGEPITALMRHSDDYMLFGCQSSVWILRGDPNIGGTIDILDPRHGVISASAHCRGPGSSSFFLALDGLYVIPYGGNQEPIPLSKKLPQELRYINVGQNRVFLVYDVIHEGIIIAVTRIDGGTGTYFFYDMDTQGFFPMRFPSNCEPTFLHYYSADAPNQRAVLFGGRDGYIRQFDDFGRSQNDDGIDWTSKMTIGPVLLAPSGYQDGILREVIPQTAAESDDVPVSIQVGPNAESAFSAVLHNGFTAYAGTQRTWRPNLRGNAAYITFEKTGGGAWAYEKMTVVREPMGKLRV